MFCNKCGAELKPEDKFCNSCGSPVASISDEAKFSPKPEEPTNSNGTTDPYSSLDPAENPVNTTQQNNDFIAPQSGEFNSNSQPNNSDTKGTEYNPQYVPNTVGPQQGNNNTNYNPQYNPNLNTNKKSHVGLIVAIVLIVIFLPIILIGISIGVIVFNSARSTDRSPSYYNYYSDNDVSYSYNYSASRSTASNNTTPYSGYGTNSTANTKNTTPTQSSIPNKEENAIYDYINDAAVQYKVAPGFSKLATQSTTEKHLYMYGTGTYGVAAIVEGDVSDLDYLNDLSGFGVKQEDVTVYGKTYKKVTANSSYLAQAFSNTSYSDYADNFQAEIYNLQINDNCLYQFTLMYDKNTTPPDITQFLDIEYGDIKY